MDCKTLPTIPQFKGTCWFNTILMVLFYSDMMKRIILKKSEKWKNKTGLRKIFLEMITHQKYDYDIPTYILKELHKENNYIFTFNPNIRQGYEPYKYIGKILDYLNVNEYMAAYNFTNNNNFNIEVGKNIIENPDILILNINKSKLYSNKIDLNHEYVFEFFKKKSKDLIVYNNIKYKLDSCIFRNFNVSNMSHVIAGVTCNNSRYIYNGWINPDTKSPCSLIPYDWLGERGDFCLDTKNCKLDKEFVEKYPEYCFNLKKKYTHKMYIYIKETIPEIVVEKTNGKTILKSTNKKCPSTMILNPKTNRCVKISGKIGKKLIEDNK